MLHETRKVRSLKCDKWNIVEIKSYHIHVDEDPIESIFS